MGIDYPGQKYGINPIRGHKPSVYQMEMQVHVYTLTSIRNTQLHTILLPRSLMNLIILKQIKDIVQELSLEQEGHIRELLLNDQITLFIQKQNQMK